MDTRAAGETPDALVAPEGRIPTPEGGGTLGVRSQVAGPAEAGRSRCCTGRILRTTRPKANRFGCERTPRWTGLTAGVLPPAHVPRVLVVDDELYIRDLVSSALRIAGMEPVTVADGTEALRAVERDRPDLVVLDVGLPGTDGFSVCRQLRDRGDQVPVVFLTARDDKEDMLQGFTKGGDDYMTKPFSLDELIARVRAVLRRTRQAEPETSRLTYDDLELDESTMRVRRGDELIALSPTEFKLLRFLLRHKEQVVSKAQILDHVWEYDFDGNASVVENYISYLRKKLDHRDPKLIHTVRGFGYVLRRDP
jgi:two-component system OmpR family response regulator